MIGPSDPVVPVAPAGPPPPVFPVAPVAPVAPAAPVAPVGPVAPVAPFAPLAPVRPLPPVGPVAAGATGATGATGNTGGGGPAGATGTTGSLGPITYKTAEAQIGKEKAFPPKTFEVSIGERATATASCAGGERAVGGGVAILEGLGSVVVESKPEPEATPTAWQGATEVSAGNSGPSNTPGKIQTFVICTTGP